jgi:cysteine synthase
VAGCAWRISAVAEVFLADVDRRFNHSVFGGADSVRDFLNPDNHPSIPLVELPGHLNPFLQERVHIFAKAMYLLPLLSIKSLPALNMLLQAETNGELDGVHTLVENSSGNTAMSLATLARGFGIAEVKAIVPRDIAPGKLEMLRLTGADPIFSHESPGKPSGIEVARDMGKQEGVFNPAQYENPANPDAHEKWTAKQIWDQLEGKLSIFCAGFGTTGTIVGASQFFRKQRSHVSVLGVACLPDSPVPGVRSLERLKEIRFDWRTNINVIEVTARESFRKSLELCRTGLMAGPSSGFALAGLLAFLRAQADASALDNFRNEDGEVIAAFICADTPLPYLDKYSTHLDPVDF